MNFKLMSMIIIGSVWLTRCALADETNAVAGESDTEDLAKQAQNPVAKPISVPFQNNFNFNVGPNCLLRF